MFPKKRILISLIFLLYAYAGYSLNAQTLKEAGAVIFSGEEFHHEGLAIEASLLQKGYDVFLTQVKPEDGQTKFLKEKNWSKTPLMESLKDHYKKMLFIVTGHGCSKFGVNIAWDLLLELIKELEMKADELFIHLDTCFSGDVAEPWKSEFGKNVKIFTTGSCHGNYSVFSSELINHTNPLQIFTGYWMRYVSNEFPEHEHTCTEFEESTKKLNCDSTVQDVFKLLDRPCDRSSNKCYKIHIHKGGDEKLKNWNLLPKNLSSYNKGDEKPHNYHLGFDESCIFEDTPFDKKEDISFHRALSLQDEINSFDPVNAWRVRTVPVGYKAYAMPHNELKKIPAYARVLSINDDECDTENQQTTCKQALSNTKKLQIAYHKNRNEVWVLKFKTEEEFFQFYMIIILIVGIVMTAVCIAVCCRCGPKKRRRRQRNQRHMAHPRTMNQNFQQNQIYLEPPLPNQSQIQITRVDEPSHYGQKVPNDHYPREGAAENTFISIN